MDATDDINSFMTEVPIISKPVSPLTDLYMIGTFVMKELTSIGPGIIKNQRQCFGEQEIIRSICFLLEAKFGDNSLLSRNVQEISVCSMCVKNLRHGGMIRTLSDIFFISNVTENKVEVNICLNFLYVVLGYFASQRSLKKEFFLPVGQKNRLYRLVQYSSHFQFSISFLTFEDIFFLASVYRRCI